MVVQRTNFKMEYDNITMTRGDTVTFNIQVFDENENPVEVDNCKFTCKKRASTAETVFQKSLGDGITQSDGLITVRIAPEDTKEVEEGTYFYDCALYVANDVFTIKKGILTIEWDATF